MDQKGEKVEKTKWEYEVQNLPWGDSEEVQTQMNEMGEEGWEIICSVPPPKEGGKGWLWVIAKRPVQPRKE